LYFSLLLDSRLSFVISSNEFPFSRCRRGIEQPDYRSKTRLVLHRSILAERFNALVEARKAKVILSSTHRLYEETHCGVVAAGILFDGCTPDLPTQTRAAEITAWWQKHPGFKFRISTSSSFVGAPDFRLVVEAMLQSVFRSPLWTL
jgi:hypothetical protein